MGCEALDRRILNKKGIGKDLLAWIWGGGVLVKYVGKANFVFFSRQFYILNIKINYDLKVRI